MHVHTYVGEWSYKRMYVYLHTRCIYCTYLCTVNLVTFHVSTTSISPFSILNSLLAEVTMSEMGSAKLCSSIAKRFSRVKVLGFMSKFFLVISISFCQCLSLKASLFKSENNGMESLNSFSLSSSTRNRGMAFTSFGSLLALLMNSSIPLVSFSMSKSAHRVLDHSSRASYIQLCTVQHGPHIV